MMMASEKTGLMKKRNTSFPNCSLLLFELFFAYRSYVLSGSKLLTRGRSSMNIYKPAAAGVVLFALAFGVNAAIPSKSSGAYFAVQKRHNV